MAEQLQPTGAAAGLAALQRTASEVALLKKAVTPRLQAQGQNLVSQGRSIESRESELAHERRDLVTADSELLSIHVSSWNVGNAAPPEDLRLWLPRGGGGADIVAVCVQEATYSDPQASEDASGTLRMTVKEIRGLEGGGGGPQKLSCVAKMQSDVPKYERQSFATTVSRTNAGEQGAPPHWSAAATKASHDFNVFPSSARLKMDFSDEDTIMKAAFGTTRVDIRQTGDGALQIRPLRDTGDGSHKVHVVDIESGEGFVACDGGEVETALTDGAETVIGTVTLGLSWSAEALPAPANAPAVETPKEEQAASGMLEVELHGAEDLRAADSNGLSDPYASMSIQTPDGPRQKQKTEVANATLSPVWETNTFRFGLPSDATGLRVVLKDADEVQVMGKKLGERADLLGDVYLPAKYLRTLTTARTETLPVNYQGKRKGFLRMTLRFRLGAISVEEESPATSEPEPEPEPEPEEWTASASTAAVDLATTLTSAAKDGVAAASQHKVGLTLKQKTAEVLNTNAMTAGALGDGDDHFFKTVQAALGDGYKPIGEDQGGQKLHFTLFQMRLFVFCKEELSPHMTNIQHTAVATGIGGVVANKGGIVAQFEYRGEPICFVCTHLAAHQGAKHRAQVTLLSLRPSTPRCLTKYCLAAERDGQDRPGEGAGR